MTRAMIAVLGIDLGKSSCSLVGLDRFGGSAPGEIVMRELGFTPEQVVKAAKSLIRGHKPG